MQYRDGFEDDAARRGYDELYGQASHVEALEHTESTEEATYAAAGPPRRDRWQSTMSSSAPLTGPAASPPWKNTLEHLHAILAVGAVVVYGYLSICYEVFYGHLGVNPADVGLSYAGTLARSAGFVVAFLTGAVLLFPLLPFARPNSPPPGNVRRKLGLLILAFALALVSAVGLSSAQAAASKVEAGKPVNPPDIEGPIPIPLVVLAIHADPATVEPTGKRGDSPAAERLRGRELLYLGQSDGTMVLYDAAARRAVYVPASSIILHVADCDAKPPPDPACPLD
jgi:hypothetical protein